jgi:hypothetical protein
MEEREENEKKKQKKIEQKEREISMVKEGFPGPDLPYWLCSRLQLSGAIKG